VFTPTGQVGLELEPGETHVSLTVLTTLPDEVSS
jgi:hypothetical protein